MIKRQRVFYAHHSHAPRIWPTRLLKVHRPQDLQIQRRPLWSTLPLACRDIHAGRTATRTCHQRVCGRYAEGLLLHHSPQFPKSPPLGDGEEVQRQINDYSSQMMTQISALRKSIAEQAVMLVDAANRALDMQAAQRRLE